MKRVAKFGDRDVSDVRVFTESDYFLSTEFVDKYKDEVKGGAETPPPGLADEPSDGSGDESDGEEKMFDHCTRNWKAAARDEDKTMWRIFAESGIFACACRHGLILWIADMVMSGELYVFGSIHLIIIH